MTIKLPAKTITENYLLIQQATAQGATVRNAAGERLLVAKNYDDAVKVYPNWPKYPDLYYLGTAMKQTGLTFDGVTYEEWKERPIKVS